MKKKIAELEKDLFALDQNIKVLVSNNQRQPLIASHPVYDYFARRYGLNFKNVHWEPDQVPGEAQWRALKAILKRHPATWMIWEGKPDQVSLDILKNHGMDSLVFEPCGNAPPQGDFMTVMQRNVENLRAAFQ